MDLALTPDHPAYFGTAQPIERAVVRDAMSRVSRWNSQLTARALDGLGAIPGITIYGQADAARRTSLVAFNLAGRDPVTVAGDLNRAGIESRAGCHCATLAHHALGLDPPASCRLSFYLYNTPDEVDQAVAAVAAIAGHSVPRAPWYRFWSISAEAAARPGTDPGPVVMTVLDAAAERKKLRRVLGRLDTIFFLISAMVVVDTIGAIAIGGGQAFTWLIVLFVTFFIPSALISAELGAAIPEEGGVYVWVRRAFGRYAGALTSLLYWAGTPMWLGGSVAVVAMAVWQQFFGGLSLTGLYLFGTVFIGLATACAVIPLRFGKWIPTSGAIGQIALLAFFTSSVVLYGVRNGVHGITATDLSPSRGVFIAIVPVLLYSFVGVELPATAAEEMTNPRRDIPVAIGRAGIGQALMYGVPILAVLIVLPAEQITSLHGLIDAIQTVLASYGGSIAADGTVVLAGWGQVLGWACAIVFIWVLLASGCAWIMGAGRAQAAACLDGAGPRSAGPDLSAQRGAGDHGTDLRRGLLAGHGRRSGRRRPGQPEVFLCGAGGLDRTDRAGLPADLPGVCGPALAGAQPEPALPGPRRRSHGLAGHGPGHGMVPAGRRLPAVARARHCASGRRPARGLRVAAWAVRTARAHPHRSGDRRDDGLLPRYSPRPEPTAPAGRWCLIDAVGVEVRVRVTAPANSDSGRHGHHGQAFTGRRSHQSRVVRTRP